MWTYLKAHRTSTSLRSKKGSDDQRGRLIGRAKGGMNTKLHAVTDANGRYPALEPLRRLESANQGAWLLNPPSGFTQISKPQDAIVSERLLEKLLQT